MEFGYAIQVLREKLADDSYELTLAVEQKDEEMQEREKERLAILQDAMNALAKPSSVPQANELLPHVSGSALLAAFDVCFTMREWCGNVIAGADKDDDTTKDKEMLDKCNAFIGWFKEHYR